MPKMFHDVEEEVVRRRISKARDERSNPKYRLENALEIVELVARMLDAPTQDEDPGPEPSAQEELEAITDAPEVVGEDGGYED